LYIISRLYFTTHLRCDVVVNNWRFRV